MVEHSQASMGLGSTEMRKYVHCSNISCLSSEPFFQKGRKASTYDNHSKADKSQGVLSRQRVGMAVGKFEISPKRIEFNLRRHPFKTIVERHTKKSKVNLVTLKTLALNTSIYENILKISYMPDHSTPLRQCHDVYLSRR